MLVVFKRQFAELEVGGWDFRYDHDIDVGVSDHVFTGTVELDAWMVFGGVIVGSGVPLNDGVEIEGWSNLDQGDVEDLG